MNNFVVIDHSIKRIGGHNYEYALHILSAAERQGFRPILAVNRRFFERRRLPACWQLYTPFRHTTYEVVRLAGKQRQLDPDGVLIGKEASCCPSAVDRRSPRGWMGALPAWLRRYLARRYDRAKGRIIDRYAADLGRLFSALPLRAGDQIFVPTLSEDDLAGLLAFFRQHTSAASVPDWHLQFHFKIYHGREPQYDAQEVGLEGLKQLFHDAAGALARDCLRFYTTTDILADQYNRLGAAGFHALPYPVNPALLAQRNHAQPTSPLRVTCAGGVRPEKGTAELYRSVAPLWHDYFETGRLQLVVQAKRLGKLPPELRRHARYDREPARVDQPAGASPGLGGPISRRASPKVAVIRWPLSTRRYLELIRNSHVGLLLYDAEQYFARCSGVMVEMLKAGVPVIVPAGCWMAEQIAEPIFAHRDRLCQTLPIVARLTPADVDWEAGRDQRYYLWRRDARLLVGGGPTDELVTHLDVPPGTSHICIRFGSPATSPRGRYLELSAAQFSDMHRHLQTTREIVGTRACGAAVPVLMQLSPTTRHIELRWRNAFSHNKLSLENVEFLFFSAAAAAYPLGAVGLVAAGIDQAQYLLRDIADHYAHYRRTAEEFAPAWGEWHSPEKVVRLLTETHGARQRSAA